MPNRAVRVNLMDMYNEVKFQEILSVYYPGLTSYNEDVRRSLNTIINTTILEIYSKLDSGIVWYELMDIVRKGQRNFQCFDLSSDDQKIVRAYLFRIIFIVEWDRDEQELIDELINTI